MRITRRLGSEAGRSDPRWLPALIGSLLAVALLAACSFDRGSEQSLDTPSIETGSTSSATTDQVSVEENSGADPGGGELPPITGYGDFSSYAYADVDWFEVTRLEVKCLNDNGFPARVEAPGNGMTFEDIAVDQHAAALAAFDACEAGLSLPPYERPNAEQLAKQYEFLLELQECLLAEGYDTSPAPSLDAFVENWETTAWTPYDEIISTPTITFEEWNALNTACPQA